MVGILISVIGIVFLITFLSKPVNPDVTIGNLGLLTVLLGVLVVASDLFAKRVQLRGTTTMLAVAGWSLFSAGLLVGFAGFLLANQVMCSCPAYGPCTCGVPLYNLMLSAGTLTAVAGAAVITSSSLLVHRRPVEKRRQ